MSLYPSLEDMKVDQLAQAQVRAQQATAQAQHQVTYPHPAGQAPSPQAVPAAGSYGSLYPSLDEYMGLEMTPQFMAQNMPVVAQNPPQNMQVGVRQTQAGQMQVAPVTGNDVGLRRAEIKQGIREVTLCKDGSGKVGLRVRHVNKGIFVALVHKDTPAAMAGLRFGDQILQINGENVAGWDTNKTLKVIKNASPQQITMAVRDRPFERTITMQKDSTGHIGFIFKEGEITSIVKDSSAARNGVLIDHQLTEVNGQNVVGLKDKEVAQIFDTKPKSVTITFMPSFLYKHIIKCMGASLVNKLMDHSIPDF